MNLFFVLLALYVSVLLYVSWRISRQESEEGYLIADRDRPWWQVMASKYAASVGAGWFVVYGGFSYEFGAPISFVFLGAIVGVLLYAYWATPRIRAVSAGCYTQGDYVFACTKSVTAKDAMNIIVSAASLLTLLIAAVGAATLFESFGVMSYELSVIFTVVVVLSYILLSGFKAVVFTDLVQGALLFILLGFVVWSMSQSSFASAETLLEVRNITPLGVAMITLFGIVVAFSDPTRYQVTFAGESTQAVKKGMATTIIPLFLTAFAIYLIGSTVYELDSGLISSAVFPYALETFLPESLLGIGFLLFFVALMSTADSVLYALSTHTAHFFFKGDLQRYSVQITTVGYAMLVVLLSILFRDVVDIAVLAGALVLVIAFPMFYIIGGGTNGIRFNLLLGGGIFGAAVGIAVFGLEPDAGAFVVVGNLIATVIPVRWFSKEVAKTDSVV